MSKETLRHALDYACDPGKTVSTIWQEGPDGVNVPYQVRYVSGINCSPDTAEQQFRDTVSFWSRVYGRDLDLKRYCYTGYISFGEGEADAQTAHGIALDLAERIWGDACEAVVATHVNTGNIHSHFVINAVRLSDGHRLSGGQKNLWSIRRTADRVCREHGLQVREEKYGRKVSRAAHDAERQGKPSFKNLVRWDIDSAVRDSFTVREMEEKLRDLGYEVDLGSVNASIKPPGAEHAYRLRLLGSEYDPQRLKERVLNNSERPSRDAEDLRRKAGSEISELLSKGRKEGVCGTFRLYRDCLGILLKYPGYTGPVHQGVRKDLIYTDRIDRSLELMYRERITERDDLYRYLEARRAEYDRLLSQRRGWRNMRDRDIYRGDMESSAVHSELAKLITPVLSEVRKSIKTAEYIAENDERISRNLGMIIHRDQMREVNEMIRKEDMGDGQLLSRGGGPGGKDNAGRDGDRGQAGGVRSEGDRDADLRRP